MWSIFKQPSGDNGFYVKDENGQKLVLSAQQGDARFWQIEADLQREQRQKHTQAAVDKLNKKK